MSFPVEYGAGDKRGDLEQRDEAVVEAPDTCVASRPHNKPVRDDECAIAIVMSGRVSASPGRMEVLYDTMSRPAGSRMNADDASAMSVMACFTRPPFAFAARVLPRVTAIVALGVETVALLPLLRAARLRNFSTRLGGAEWRVPGKTAIGARLLRGGWRE